MKIKYLGTAAAEGIPAFFCNCDTCKKALIKKGRNIMTRSQALIDDNLLVDFNGDTYMHFLKLKRTLFNIENVLITHSHEDHLSYELFTYRNDRIAYNVTAEKLNMYTNDKVIEQLHNAFIARRENVAKIDSKFNFIPLELYKEYKINGYSVIPLPANHALPEQAYLYLISKDNKTIFYGNDTGIFTTEIDEFLASRNIHIDLLSLDCTKGIVETSFYGHMSMNDCKTIYNRFKALNLIDDKTICVMTHFSHNAQMTYDKLSKESKKYGFICAYDGLEIEV